jgi:hypothetical protein
VGVLFLLLVAIAMSVGGGALLSKASGVSTWWRSTLFSAGAHAIGIPLWIAMGFHLFPRNYFEDMPLVADPAAAYAIVVPIMVVFCAFRRDAPMRLAITLPLAIATVALPVRASQTESEGLALASGLVAWVVLPAVSVLGWAMIGPRNH